MEDKIGLIAKFLGREANVFELERLEKVMHKDKFQVLFKQMVETQYIVSLAMKNYKVDNAKKSFRKKVRRSITEQRFSIAKKLGIAASLLFLVALTAIDLSKDEKKLSGPESFQHIQAGTDRAILTLGNGNRVVLVEGKKYESERASGNGKTLAYRRDNKEPKSEYNFLTVPRGGQFQITLQDGTKVWLNSESKIKYPESFPKNRPREVELLYGEVYLKVSPSKEHNGAPFNLVTEGQKIQVLGTEFNVRSYADEDLIKTTLVEGSVTVTSDKEQKHLKPHYQSLIKKGSGGIEIHKVDVSQEISWMEGLFTFDNQSLDNIMKTLARWYDVEVVFESPELKTFAFTGILGRTSTIQDILHHIEESNEKGITFEITNRTILVKQNLQ